MAQLSAPARAGLSSYLRDTWRHRDFATNLAMGNIAAQNAPTRLGPLWWLVNPVIMTSIYFLVFGLILGGSRGDPQFLAYLVGGIIAFRLTAQGLTGSTSAVLNNGKLITNIAFPRLVLPVAAILENLLGFSIAFVAIYSILFPAAGLPFTWGMLILPVALLLHVLFTFGIGTLMARFAVQYRDIKNLLPHLTRIWLYLSPILWQLSLLDDKPAWARGIVQANPLFPYLGLYRTVTLGDPLNPAHLGLAAFWAVLFLVLGVWTFYRFDGRMARYL